MKFILGIDIGGTHIRLGLVAKKDHLTHFQQLKTDTVFTSSDPIKDLATMINSYLDKTNSRQHVIAVAIGFPSTVDKSSKIVLSTPNIPTLQNINIVDGLAMETGFPVYIGRDVHFLMVFDLYKQQLSTSGVILGFYFGTGIGNAIFIDGKPLRGKNGVAAELGHVPIIHDDSVCTCGNVGCVENYASGRYLAKLALEEFPDCDISDLFTFHGNHHKITTFIENMAIVIATEVNLLDPEYIILGGGILQMKNFPKTTLEAKIKEKSRKPVPSENLDIYYAQTGQENGVIGAAIHAFKQ